MQLIERHLVIKVLTNVKIVELLMLCQRIVIIVELLEAHLLIIHLHHHQLLLLFLSHLATLFLQQLECAQIEILGLQCILGLLGRIVLHQFDQFLIGKLLFGLHISQVKVLRFQHKTLLLLPGL